jgi:hypothetical protein
VASNATRHSVDACPRCGGTKQTTSRQCGDCKNGRPSNPPAHVSTVADDRERQKASSAMSSLKRRYDEALKTIESQEKQLATVNALSSGLETYIIEPKQGSGTSEGTVVAVASDWHIEENVGAEVGGLNVYNIEIAKKRATKFFQSLLRLVRLLQQDIRIDHLVLALLGDFITNDIHDAENAETNELLPTHAIVEAQNMIVSGIDFLLANSKLNIVIPCHSGNHARTTKTTRFATENGHSLEYLMYLHLRTHFRFESRVEFIISPGMHTYLDVYGQTLRFHHGHASKYQGGVGGIYIPVNKTIAQWNKGRAANLDVFGHFHQLRDGGNFICNGSLIGYNAFALSIKADYEQPKQALFLMDKRRGRTCTWPILVADAPR